MRRTARFLTFAVLAMLLLPAARRRIVRSDPAPPSAAVSAVHYRGGASRSGVYAAGGPAHFSRRSWRAQTAEASFSSPVFADGALYAVDGNGRVVAFDGSSGAPRWTSAVLGSVLSTVTVTSDRVFVGVNGHAVIALAVTDGHQLARYEADAEVFASPLVDNGTLYIATESGALHAYDLASAAKKWEFHGPGPAHGYPAAANGVVYYGSGGALVAVNADGSERWRLQGPTPFFSPSLAVVEDVVYGSAANHAYAVDALTGTVKWTFDGPAGATAFLSAPVVMNGLVIYGGGNPFRIFALNGGSGTVAWQKTLPAITEPIAADGIVYGGAAQIVYAWDPLNGAELSTFATSGEIATGLAVGGGRVYVHTQARNVDAIE
jgi:outer membrane protein assembly factor BamB